MSAEQYGSNLLESVHEESLEQLLSDIRRSLCPQPRLVLGIPPLDDLLESVRYPAESGAYSHRGWTSSRAQSPDPAAGDYDDDASEILNSDDERNLAQRTQTKPAIIEVTSQRSGCGKTNLLYYMSATSILPTELGGRQSITVWIDSDGRFSATRLSQITQSVLQQRTPGASESELLQTTRDALHHVHVFKPQSSSQVLSVLRVLPTYLLDSTRHRSSHRTLGLLIMDSATAFLAQDRFAAEMARMEDTPGPNPPVGAAKPHFNTRAIIAQLRSIQARFECCVLYSTYTSTTSTVDSRPPDAPPEASAAISAWTAAATLTLTVERAAVPQFAPQMTLEQCMRDAERRMEVVAKGRFMLSVDVGGAGRNRNGKDRGKGSLVLRITADGVAVE